MYECSFWPAFVPVHDPSRKAYIGIQNMGTTFTRRFEADRVGTLVPIKLMHLEGLYELFVSKFVSSLDASISCYFILDHYLSSQISLLHLLIFLSTYIDTFANSVLF